MWGTNIEVIVMSQSIWVLALGHHHSSLGFAVKIFDLCRGLVRWSIDRRRLILVCWRDDCVSGGVAVIKWEAPGWVVGLVDGKIPVNSERYELTPDVSSLSFLLYSSSHYSFPLLLFHLHPLSLLLIVLSTGHSVLLLWWNLPHHPPL